MPITEVVREIAIFVDGDGGEWGLWYDTDGRFGADEQAMGRPKFWWRNGGRTLGPFEDELSAMDLAQGEGWEPRGALGRGVRGSTT